MNFQKSLGVDECQEFKKQLDNGGTKSEKFQKKTSQKNHQNANTHDIFNLLKKTNNYSNSQQDFQLTTKGLTKTNLYNLKLSKQTIKNPFIIFPNNKTNSNRRDFITKGFYNTAHKTKKIYSLDPNGNQIKQDQKRIYSNRGMGMKVYVEEYEEESEDEEEEQEIEPQQQEEEQEEENKEKGSRVTNETDHGWVWKNKELKISLQDKKKKVKKHGLNKKEIVMIETLICDNNWNSRNFKEFLSKTFFIRNLTNESMQLRLKLFEKMKTIESRLKGTSYLEFKHLIQKYFDQIIYLKNASHEFLLLFLKSFSTNSKKLSKYCNFTKTKSFTKEKANIENQINHKFSELHLHLDNKTLQYLHYFQVYLERENHGVYNSWSSIKRNQIQVQTKSKVNKDLRNRKVKNNEKGLEKEKEIWKAKGKGKGKRKGKGKEKEQNKINFYGINYQKSENDNKHMLKKVRKRTTLKKSNKKIKRTRLLDVSKDILIQWFQEREKTEIGPYASIEEKRHLANLCNISEKQVTTFLGNMRRKYKEEVEKGYINSPTWLD
ncbi:chromatin assembly factor 1 subunit a [Anaeramoeba flamelloides]|uniref:Chromatin assembly factor 1 subunit a n=1 Tax=Anaeramoeba flamelloides TaxID=1746091 RepID=A0AAV7YCL9_9EUKA|nr:chromatin assembly factor 1 subunit a [Anaeramoeba flamelloides]